MNNNIEKSSLVRISVLDCNQSIRDGLRWLLTSVSGIKCLGVYGSLCELMAGMSEQSPDVLLMDAKIQQDFTYDYIASIKADFPAVKILVHTEDYRPEHLLSYKRSGASGYVTKYASGPKLYDLILRVNREESLWHADLQPHDNSG